VKNLPYTRKYKRSFKVYWWGEAVVALGFLCPEKKKRKKKFRRGALGPYPHATSKRPGQVMPDGHKKGGGVTGGGSGVPFLENYKGSREHERKGKKKQGGFLRKI